MFWVKITSQVIQFYTRKMAECGDIDTNCFNFFKNKTLTTFRKKKYFSFQEFQCL